uniref:ShKT domain-containing protein n=1 Tax=Bursaphelenchus xylophilus TaxID=6326 RepID=A0A1I7S153_BURXY
MNPTGLELAMENMKPKMMFKFPIWLLISQNLLLSANARFVLYRGNGSVFNSRHTTPIMYLPQEDGFVEVKRLNVNFGRPLMELLAEECPQTCGLCDSTTPSQDQDGDNDNGGGDSDNEGGGDASCVDNNPDCPIFVENGFCNPGLYSDETKKATCGKSCGLCYGAESLTVGDVPTLMDDRFSMARVAMSEANRHVVFALRLEQRNPLVSGPVARFFEDQTEANLNVELGFSDEEASPEHPMVPVRQLPLPPVVPFNII